VISPGRQNYDWQSGGSRVRVPSPPPKSPIKSQVRLHLAWDFSGPPRQELGLLIAINSSTDSPAVAFHQLSQQTIVAVEDGPELGVDG
jgi:hypothetical protein